VTSPAPASTVWIGAARLFAVLTLLVVCVSFGTAGVLIQRGQAEEVHGYAAIALHIATAGLTVGLAGFVYEQRRHWWTVVVAALLLIYTFVQAALGEGASLYLHVPGALLVAAATVWLTAWLFTSKSVVRQPHSRNSRGSAS
jgi:hypothetical protein